DIDSTANPHNPSNPPKHAVFGEQTTNEMALLFLQAVMPRAGDAVRFRREFGMSRVAQFLAEGGEPAGLRRETIARLRAAIRCSTLITTSRSIRKNVPPSCNSWPPDSQPRSDKSESAKIIGRSIKK